MSEYLISQHDPRGERPEQLAAVKAVHTYNLEYGFPVAAGADDGNGPSPSWQRQRVEHLRSHHNLCEVGVGIGATAAAATATELGSTVCPAVPHG